MTLKENNLFIQEEKPQQAKSQKKDSWKVLIVDDEHDIHNITKLTFEDFSFEQKNIKFLSAYSLDEAKDLIQKNPDTALILLDVVMEEPDSGLQFVKYLREELKNNIVRIILRTGHPGSAPESKIIIDYDINDYKEKTELTATKLCTAIVVALRAFRDLKTIEEAKHNLQEISDASVRFIPRMFLKILNKESIVNVKLGDHVEQEMTVLFLDIRSFTALAESQSPLTAFQFINSCMSYLEPTIVQYEGFIDKYLGDAIMALFCGAADNALHAAIDMLKSLNKYNELRNKQGDEEIKVGIGIDTGNLAMGTIGFYDRMDFTAISNVVNVSAKLEKFCKEFRANLLITERSLRSLKSPENFSYRMLGDVQIHGLSKPIAVFEVYDADSLSVKSLKDQTKETFEKAVIFYNASKYQEAHALFAEVYSINKNDEIAKIYMDSTNLLLEEKKR